MAGGGGYAKIESNSVTLGGCWLWALRWAPFIGAEVFPRKKSGLSVAETQ